MDLTRFELNWSSGGRAIVEESPSCTCAVDNFQSNLSIAKLPTYSGPVCGSFAEFTLVRLTLVISIWGLTSAAAGAASPWTTIPRAARSATATPATLDLTALDNRLLIDVCMLSPFIIISWNQNRPNTEHIRVSSPHGRLQRNPTTAIVRISNILQPPLEPRAHSDQQNRSQGWDRFTLSRDMNLSTRDAQHHCDWWDWCAY